MVIPGIARYKSSRIRHADFADFSTMLQRCRALSCNSRYGEGSSDSHSSNPTIAARCCAGKSIPSVLFPMSGGMRSCFVTNGCNTRTSTSASASAHHRKCGIRIWCNACVVLRGVSRSWGDSVLGKLRDVTLLPNGSPGTYLVSAKGLSESGAAFPCVTHAGWSCVASARHTTIKPPARHTEASELCK